MQVFIDMNGALTNEDLTDSETQRKDKERQEEEVTEVTEESKRFMLQRMVRESPLFEETLSVFETEYPIDQLIMSQ